VISNKFDGDILAIERREFALAHGDEGGEILLEDTVLEVELGVVLPNVIRIFAHLDGVKDPQVLYLVVTHFINKGEPLLHFIRLYATDKVQIGVCRHFTDQIPYLLSNFHPKEPLVALQL
jgi:hypothetical protein